MKKVIFSIVFLSGLSLASLAQQPHNNQGGQHQGGKGKSPEKLTAQEKAQKLTQYMTTELSLTAEQQQKVSALNESKAVQMDSIKSQHKGNMEAAKPEAKKVKDSYNTRLKTILTAEQLTKWEALKKQKKEEIQKAKTEGTRVSKEGLTPEDIE